MLRAKRNRMINKIYAKSNTQRSVALEISAAIGDSEEIDLDWDDLESITGIEDIDKIEEHLNDMFDDGILLILDYEQSIIG